MTNTAVETKAQRVERLKREKNPWEGLDDIRKFAREGFDSITPEWLGTYFRWWGVYTQGDGAEWSAARTAKARRCRSSWCASASPMACFTLTSCEPLPL
jgi:hypothetical protein